MIWITLAMIIWVIAGWAWMLAHIGRKHGKDKWWERLIVYPGFLVLMAMLWPSHQKHMRKRAENDRARATSSI